MILELNVLKNNIYIMFIHNWKSFNESIEPINTEGGYKKVFISESNPDIVIKTFDLSQVHLIKSEVMFYETAPELFAKIYNIDYDKGSITQERLDINKVYDELKKLGEYFSNLDLIDSNVDYEVLNFIKKLVVQNISIDDVRNFLTDKNLFNIFNRWFSIVKKVMKIGIELDIQFDINPNNFGYDKEGNLKLFDI